MLLRSLDDQRMHRMMRAKDSQLTKSPGIPASRGSEAVSVAESGTQK